MPVFVDDVLIIDKREKNKEKAIKSYIRFLLYRIENDAVVIDYPNHDIEKYISDIPHSFIELPVKLCIRNGKSKLTGYGTLPEFLDFIDPEHLDDPEDEFPVTNITPYDDGYAEGKQTFVVYYDNHKISDDLGFGIDFYNQTAVIFLKRGNMFYYYKPGNTTKSSDIHLTTTKKEYKLNFNTDEIPPIIMYEDTSFERYHSFTFDDHIVNLKHIAVVY